METSAKTGEGVEDLFIKIGKYYNLFNLKYTYNMNNLGMMI